MLKYALYCINHFSEFHWTIRYLTYSAIFFVSIYLLTLAKP